MAVSLAAPLFTSGPPSLARLKVEQYDQMLELDILEEGTALELIDGYLLEKDRADRGKDPQHKNRHSQVVERLKAALGAGCAAAGWHVQQHEPIVVSLWSAPEPDLAVVTCSLESLEHVPNEENLALIIEVSNGTLDFDRRVRVPLYAAAGVPLWIVNLVDSAIETYGVADREAATYGKLEVLRPGQMLLWEAASPLELAVADILG